MTASIAHRGPDGEGFLLRGNIGFGHRRLSIIDIVGGDQPIFNEDGRIGIVFNGEIYNYVELIDALIARGHVFSTRSDTEVIVHLYEEYGQRCVEHLRGMFAFAVWDGRDRSVLLARDRLGIKPLFYTDQGDRLLFGSELKAILADPSVRRRICGDALAAYLAFGYVPGDTCILEGIHKLQPGHTLTWRDGGTSVRRYWDVSFDPREALQDEAERRLEGCLTEAVRIHLRSDVPVGVLLSGGVDSSCMVAFASEVSPYPIKTFSIGFAEADFDELAAARAVAEYFHTEHHEFVVSDRHIDALDKLVWHLDEPFADPSALPTYFVCREAARHVKVCLSGDGADEVFAGYTRYRQALQYERYDAIPRPARRLVARAVAAVLPHVMWGRGALERFGGTTAQRYFNMLSVFPERECRALLHERPVVGDGVVSRIDAYFGPSSPDLLTSLQHTDQKCYLPDDILVKVDRTSMQNSLEVRPPFLDHEVVELANTLPSGLKLANGTGKAILKRLMRGHLPASTLTRKKIGFGLPIKHWFRNELDSFAADMLLAPDSVSARWLDPAAVRGVIQAHCQGMRDFSRRIWSLVVFEQWCRAYKV